MLPERRRSVGQEPPTFFLCLLSPGSHMPELDRGNDGIYRGAKADFNVRGWQGRLRYTALTALFFSCGRIARPPPNASVPIPAASSQAGDLRSAAIVC